MTIVLSLGKDLPAYYDQGYVCFEISADMAQNGDSKKGCVNGRVSGT
jgi:hypothetical protein